MHFMLFLDRSSHTSKCLSVLTTTTTTTAIHITIVTIILFFTSVRARVIGTQTPLDHPEELFIIEEFKRRILEHMGLSSPPTFPEQFENTTRLRETYSNEIQHFLQRMHHDNNHYHHNNFHHQSRSNVNSKIFTLQLKSPVQYFKVPTAKDVKHSSISTIVRFTAPSSLKQGLPYTKFSLKSAALRMRIRQHKDRLRNHRTSTKSLLNIRVSLLHEDTNSEDESPNSTLLKSFIVNPYKKSFVIEFGDMKHQLSSLFSSVSASNNNNIVFEISATEIPVTESMMGHRVANDHHDRPNTTSDNRKHNNYSKLKTRTRPEHSGSYISIVPELKVKIMQEGIPKSRSRRSSTSGCSSGSLCCRHSVYISFEEIGWKDWVISPEGYTAYFCKGGCPKRYKPANIFSGIKASLHEKNPNDMPAPICAASGYRSLNLLHMSDKGLVETSYPDMIVMGCKCF